MNGLLEQFQEKCETVRLGGFAVAFRPELRQNKREHFAVSVKRRNILAGDLHVSGEYAAQARAATVAITIR
jgi:hypothetical protein